MTREWIWQQQQLEKEKEVVRTHQITNGPRHGSMVRNHYRQLSYVHEFGHTPPRPESFFDKDMPIEYDGIDKGRWEKRYSRERKRRYWLNLDTGESSWKNPATLNPKVDARDGMMLYPQVQPGPKGQQGQGEVGFTQGWRAYGN